MKQPILALTLSAMFSPCLPHHPLRSTWARASLCALGLGLGLLAPHAQAQQLPELPLSGPAYFYADDAYKAYARGEYNEAVTKLREALRLRPESTQLRTFLKKAEAARNAQRPTQGGKSKLARSGTSASVRRTAPARTTAKSETNAVAANNSKQPAKTEVQQTVPRESFAAVADTAPVKQPSAFDAATTAYQAFDKRNYSEAVTAARQAVQLAPVNRAYRLLLLNALDATAQYEEAEAAATALLTDQAATENAPVFAQRGLIRQHLGKTQAAHEDFAAALHIGNLPAATETRLLADLGRISEARRRYDKALTDNSLASTSDVDLAYIAVRVGDDSNAYAAFNRADAAGALKMTAYQDAAFAALRTRHDAQSIRYFKRSIDENNALRLRMEPQLLFDTRRTVAEVSRQTGIIASLTYRGAVSGIGPARESGTDSLQAGTEAYWRPWGYQNGRYVELFARAFVSLYSKGNDVTGMDTLQSAAGIRYKPLKETNLVTSLSYVSLPRAYRTTGRRDDWLAQLGYSAGSGTDLRVDVPRWWTTRISAEAGRYLSGRKNYALAYVESGQSILIGDAGSKWVAYPHLSFAADYDSDAMQRSSMGAGPGFNMRYWFREDVYNAPRSYLDATIQYRWRLSGAQSAEGLFMTTTLSY